MSYKDALIDDIEEKNDWREEFGGDIITMLKEEKVRGNTKYKETVFKSFKVKVNHLSLQFIE
jgi:hypothetical protein